MTPPPPVVGTFWQPPCSSHVTLAQLFDALRLLSPLVPSFPLLSLLLASLVRFFLMLLKTQGYVHQPAESPRSVESLSLFKHVRVIFFSPVFSGRFGSVD